LTDTRILGPEAAFAKRGSSRLHPRHVVPKPAQAYEPKVPVKMLAFIAETIADLAGLARRHKLDMLSFLLGMAQREAEEHLRLRSKGNLS
jgi:hypothetical protein